MKTSQIVTETTETAGHILWILCLRLYDFSPAWKGIIFSASKTVLSPVLEWIAIGYDDPPRTRQCQMVKLTILRDLSKAEFWPLLCPPWSGWDRLRGMESDIPKCTGEATAFLSNQLPASQCLFWGFPCLQCLPSQVCTDFKYSHWKSFYFKCVPGTANISIASELIRNAGCQALFQTYGVRICILTRCPDNSHAMCIVHLRGAGLNYMADVILLPRHLQWLPVAWKKPSKLSNFISVYLRSLFSVNPHVLCILKPNKTQLCRYHSLCKNGFP